jgi:hypothetical protein
MPARRRDPRDSASRARRERVMQCTPPCARRGRTTARAGMIAPRGAVHALAAAVMVATTRKKFKNNGVTLE